MMRLLDWVWANPEKAIGAAYFILNILNALLPKGPGWAAGLSGKLHIILDRISVLARSDGHKQTLKVPGEKSKTETVAEGVVNEEVIAVVEAAVEEAAARAVTDEYPAVGQDPEVPRPRG